jgi:hypothetical protein
MQSALLGTCHFAEQNETRDSGRDRRAAGRKHPQRDGDRGQCVHGLQCGAGERTRQPACRTQIDFVSFCVAGVFRSVLFMYCVFIPDQHSIAE